MIRKLFPKLLKVLCSCRVDAASCLRILSCSRFQFLFFGKLPNTHTYTHADIHKRVRSLERGFYFISVFFSSFFFFKLRCALFGSLYVAVAAVVLVVALFSFIFDEKLSVRASERGRGRQRE